MPPRRLRASVRRVQFFASDDPPAAPMPPLPADEATPVPAAPGHDLSAELAAEIVASAEETRRGHRRILEILRQFGGVLEALSTTVNDTHRALRSNPAAAAPAAAGSDGLPRELFAGIIALADRSARVVAAATPPAADARSWWPAAQRALDAWRGAWQTQADAIRILDGHLHELLARAGLERIVVVGQPFDPRTMHAVESVADRSHPDHTVIDELLPGWRHAPSATLLRPAEVRVARHPAAL